jgi:hypothetical protein
VRVFFVSFKALNIYRFLKLEITDITKYNDIQEYIDKQTMISQLRRTDRVIYL